MISPFSIALFQDNSPGTWDRKVSFKLLLPVAELIDVVVNGLHAHMCTPMATSPTKWA